MSGPLAGRRGSYAILFALLLAMLCGFAAIAIDGNYIHMIRAESRHATEAAAHAAAVAWARSHDVTAALAVAAALLPENSVGGAPVAPGLADFEMVGCDWSLPSNTCAPDVPYRNGVRARLGGLSGEGAFPLFLAPLIGGAGFEATQEATWAIRSTNVYLVLDVSYPMRGAMTQARAALQAYLDELWHSPQDRVGLITVVGVAASAANIINRPWYPITILPTPAALLSARTTLGNLDWCSCPFCTPTHVTAWSPRCDMVTTGTFSGVHRGVNHGAGISLAVNQLRSSAYADRRTEQTIVVVTNQAPNNPSTPSDDATWRTQATSAANAAQANDISVHVVYLNDSGLSVPRDFMASLVRGIGSFEEVLLPVALSPALNEVARSVPVARVQ